MSREGGLEVGSGRRGRGGGGGAAHSNKSIDVFRCGRRRDGGVCFRSCKIR